MLDRCQANVAIDPPATTAEQERLINEAYADVYHISGGGIKRIAHGTAWTETKLDATGFLSGKITDISRITTVYRSVTVGSTGAVGDTPLDPVDSGHLAWLRGQVGMGTYSVPKVYSLRRLDTTTPADVNKLVLDYWPQSPAVNTYLPIHYIPQFTILDSVTVTTPNVNDLESRDIALLAAARLAPLIGRAELVPSILADVSQRTAAALERKMKAMLSAEQDR